jgi:hypothetical protein
MQGEGSVYVDTHPMVEDRRRNVTAGGPRYLAMEVKLVCSQTGRRQQHEDSYTCTVNRKSLVQMRRIKVTGMKDGRGGCHNKWRGWRMDVYNELGVGDLEGTSHGSGPVSSSTLYEGHADSDTEPGEVVGSPWERTFVTVLVAEGHELKVVRVTPDCELWRLLGGASLSVKS